MKKIFKLYTMLQKNSRSDDAKSKVDPNALLRVLILVVICGVLGFVCYKYAPIIVLIGSVGLGCSSTSFIIMVVGVLATVLIIFFGIMRLITSMYMSSDIEVLITMPFSGIQIAMLRVFAFFQLALIGTFCGTLAAFIGYSLVIPIAANEWVTAIVTSILLPVFDVAIVTAVVILLMSFLRIFQNREVLKVIGIIFLFFVFCGYLFLDGSAASINVQAVMSTMGSIFKKFKYIIPVIGFADDFLTTGNIIYLLLEILVTAAAFLVFFLITKALYLRGAMSMQDAGKGKRLTDADLDRYCTKKPVMKALIRKEFFMVRRDTTYLLYNFIIGALWPVVIIIVFRKMIPMISGLMSSHELAEMTNSINLRAFAIFTPIISFSILFIINIPLGLETIAFSSLSREGKSFPIMKQIPVSYKVQLEAKRRMALRVTQISILIYTALILIAASVLLKFSVLYCIIPYILTIISCEYQTDLDMMLGIANATVNWDDEKVAAKKSTGAALTSLIGFFLPLVLGIGMLFGVGVELFSIYLCPVITIAYGVLMFVVTLLLRRRIPIAGEKKIRRLRF